MNTDASIRIAIPSARWFAFGIGIFGLLGCVVGWLAAPTEFFFAYLFGFLVWLGLALGSWGFLMLHHLTGGRWGYSIRRIFEAAISTMPLMVLFFVPILLGMNYVYPWANAAKVASSQILQHKQ